MSIAVAKRVRDGTQQFAVIRPRPEPEHSIVTVRATGAIATDRAL